MAAQDAFLVADGGEVGARVPLLQNSQIGIELAGGIFIQWRAAGFDEKLVESVIRHEGILRCRQLNECWMGGGDGI